MFAFKSTAAGLLLVYWRGKHVRTYAGHKAAAILSALADSESDDEVQLVLARVTGNFKRGNERQR
jgi:hypothetical protein